MPGLRIGRSHDSGENAFAYAVACEQTSIMGIFRKAAASMGHVDHGLQKRGLLARGRVLQCDRTAMSTGNQVHQVVCNLLVEVDLPGRPLYQATCKYPIQMPYLPQFESGNASVAVRVDPDDPANITLDLTTDVPPPSQAAPTTASAAPDPNAYAQPATAPAQPANTTNKLTAAEVLATGSPCRVVIVESQPLDFSKPGLPPYYGLVLSVFVDGQAPSQVRVGVPVPDAAVPLLYPGSNVPAKIRADVQDAVTPDWDAAIIEASHGRQA